MNFLSVGVALVIYLVVGLVDWYFAYSVLYQPGIIMSAWAVVFPFLSVFYLFFYVIGGMAIYRARTWSLPLAAFILVFGCVFSILSFSIAYPTYPMLRGSFALLLIANFATLVYLAAVQIGIGKKGKI